MSKALKVSVVLITFNHEKFIEKAILSVLDQITDFDFELIVSNDASQDATDEVISSILATHKMSYKIRYFEHKKNIGMMSNFMFALTKAKGEYLAICDGDDYWLNTVKLQKQIDFLDNNTEYVACFHNSLIMKVDNFVAAENYKKLYFKEEIGSRKVTKKEIIFNGGGSFPTSSFVCRNVIVLPDFCKKTQAGDTCLVYSLLDKGEIYYLNDIYSVYRKHLGGVYTGIKDDDEKIIKDIKSNLYLLYRFEKKYLIYKDLFDQVIQKQIKRLSNRQGWKFVLKMVLIRKISIKDFYKFYFNKRKDDA